ncbi:KDPG and KHG aldolases Schiff-base forming residue [Propionibacterium ruminifibrarum]|uniref:2-dehydro-3-deoxy-phosphogluconate aldolase n=1 Tax=Propionibacterium ruminifibrarum TaxID=1962131 RepID=A0A375I1Q9_9ACTN|nr:bifunctional 4-hydroxy-2-oxoglutarate aldolase/2-dehydro-3-deoxy-phosphogluconate aldolase [Propionibacterium ruminifibrarum]SPF67142.1 KDPG and KHG aldolases Schiff-base forming residue [Propionibacterium ruminifibrarum]
MRADLSTITAHRIIPVVVLNSADRADGLAQALVEGGLPVAEVTFRTDAAAESIAIMVRRGDVLVGAGTVLDVEQVHRALDAGAGFIVSPGYNQAVVDECLGLGVPVLPGTATPSDVTAAVNSGLDTVKFFPAGAFGGARTIKALSGPFPQVRFIPTGGVSAETAGEYLALDCVPAVGGSWMVPAGLVDAGEFDQVTRLVSESVDAVKAC